MSKKLTEQNENILERPEVLKSFVVPGLPHILLCPEKKPEWQRLHNAFSKARKEIEELNPDVILIYSSYWFSILGHQFQANPNP